MDRWFRLRVPDFVSHACYFGSCRAVLVLTTCLGLQAIIVLMIAIGPLPELPYDPATLTEAGRFFLAVEYDPQAYAAGCFGCVSLACLGLWIWNRCLFMVGPERAAPVVRRVTTALLVVAVLNVAAFSAIVARVGPSLAESRRVAPASVIALGAPGALVALAVLLLAARVLSGSGSALR